MKQFTYLIVGIWIMLSASFCQPAAIEPPPHAQAAIHQPAAAGGPMALQHQLFDYAKLKGLQNLIDPAFRYLLPDSGLALIHSGWLSRAYRYRVYEKTAVNDLLGMLFNAPPQNPDDVILTKLAPIATFSPELFGKLVAYVLTGRTALLTQCDAQDYATILTTPTKKFRKPSGSQLNILQRFFTTLDKACTACDQGYYLPQTVVWLLTCAVYWKLQTKEDVYTYLAAIEQELQTFSSASASASTMLPAASDAPQSLSLKPRADVLDVLNETDLFIDTPAIPQQLSLLLATPAGSENQFDFLAYAGILAKDRAVLPPRVPQLEYGFKGQPARPNCVEAMLQNFFDILFYDGVARQMSWDLIPDAVQKSMHPALKKLYSEYSVASINMRATGQEFYNIVSGITPPPFIAYAQSTHSPKDMQYELYGDLSNVLAVINYLLGTEVASFEQLASVLSVPARSLTCTSEPPSTPNDPTIITLTVMYPATRLEETVTLSLAHGHAHSTYPASSAGQAAKFCNYGLDRLQSTTTSHPCAWYLPVIALYVDPNNPVQHREKLLEPARHKIAL